MRGYRTRPTEDPTVDAFLTSVAAGPSALLIEGEPGIGKTTRWSAAVEQACERGFRVLCARASATESVLAYSGLADLLEGVSALAWADLPAPQSLAMDRVIRHAEGPEGSKVDPVTDQRAVAAAFLSAVERLTDDGPVLLAIDDVQWLDPSSMHVVAFAARRLTGPVGVLCSLRTEPGSGASAAWLQMPRPEAVYRVRLHPLSISDLHAAVSARLRRPFSRPTMCKIHEASGGNPFYAIELARALDEKVPGIGASLPNTLNDVVRARIGSLDPEVHHALLAASCMAAPTVDYVARVTDRDEDSSVALLEAAESRGIIAIEGNRIAFAHPLLAKGVYAQTAPSRRRSMHRRLAEIVDEPELRARHLALAATSGDPVTLEALDAAADSARVRGAPAAAAELMDLAIGLGGDTPERRLRSAMHHFDAGDQERAAAVLEETIARLPAGDLRAEALSRLAIVRLYGDGFFETARLLQRGLDEVRDDGALRTGMLIVLAYAQLNGNQASASLETANQAVNEAERLAIPHLLSLALSMRVVLRFICGHGVDEDDLRRALQLQDRQAYAPLVFRPDVQHALLLEWTGRLDDAHEALEAIRVRCMEKGEEGEQIFIAQHEVLNSIMRGDFVSANLVAEQAMEQARQLGGDLPLFLAHGMRAQLAAYSGNEAEAREAIDEALEIGRRTGSFRLSERVLAALAFLEVSLGNYDAAIEAVQPMLTKFDPESTPTELPNAAYLPDAIEALVASDRLTEAEPLIEALERNGRRVDRAWMLAVGARGRAMLLAAHGDLDGARASAEAAMAAHERVPMPFERARTLLLVGQLERRQRRKEAASATLREACSEFETLNAPLWADRCGVELRRANVGQRRSDQLTPSEQRVAELAASGMRNRDVAAALFISPKTVEANLARVYRKLGIKSRAELGRSIRRGNQDEE
jgi:DNA-binding CsgD family transcriptional regulator